MKVEAEKLAKKEARLRVQQLDSEDGLIEDDDKEEDENDETLMDGGMLMAIDSPVAFGYGTEGERNMPKKKKHSKLHEKLVIETLHSEEGVRRACVSRHTCRRS